MWLNLHEIYMNMHSNERKVPVHVSQRGIEERERISTKGQTQEFI